MLSGTEGREAIAFSAPLGPPASEASGNSESEEGRADMKQITYQKGEVIFREGEFKTTMYEILHGAVGIYAKLGSPEERRLTELQAGRYFGEMGMVETFPRSASAVAEEDGTVLEEITAEDFGEYIRTRPLHVMAIMQNLSGRLRELTEEYRDVCGVIAQLEQVSGDTAEKKKGFLSSLKAKLTHFAAVYDQSAAELVQSNDVFYWTTMMNAQF